MNSAYLNAEDQIEFERKLSLNCYGQYQISGDDVYNDCTYKSKYHAIYLHVKSGSYHIANYRVAVLTTVYMLNYGRWLNILRNYQHNTGSM